MKLRVGLPKGSLQESTIALFKRAGLNVYTPKERSDRSRGDKFNNLEVIDLVACKHM